MKSQILFVALVVAVLYTAGGSQFTATATGGSRSCATEHQRVVVYGEACRLLASTQKELKIELRQTPYGLVTRR